MCNINFLLVHSDIPQTLHLYGTLSFKILYKIFLGTLFFREIDLEFIFLCLFNLSIAICLPLKCVISILNSFIFYLTL